MTGGKSPVGYLKAYMTNLYLSKDAQKVTEAIEEGKTPQTPGCLTPNIDRSGSAVCSLSVVNGAFLLRAFLSRRSKLRS